MPNTRSAAKRIRQAEKQALRNRRIKSMVKTSIRRYEEALRGDDRDSARVRLVAAVRQIDKAVAKGVVNKNNAARKKSRLARMFNQSKAG